MAEHYNLGNIRNLLTEGFTDAELRRLCYDTQEFRSVYDKLAQNTGKAEIIDQLIEYADRKHLFNQLLVLLKTLSPARYEEYLPYVITTAVDTTSVISYQQYQLVLDAISQEIVKSKSLLSEHEQREEEFEQQEQKLREQLLQIEAQLTQEKNYLYEIERDLTSLDKAKDICQKIVLTHQEQHGRGLVWVAEQIKNIERLVSGLKSESSASFPLNKYSRGDKVTQIVAQLTDFIRNDVLNSYVRLAKEQEMGKDMDGAINSLEKAALAWEQFETQDRIAMSHIQQELAYLVENRGNGIKDYLYARDLWYELGDFHSQERVWGKMAHFYEENGKELEALKAHLNRLELLGHVKQKHNVLPKYKTCLNNINRLANGLKNPSQEEHNAYRVAIDFYWEMESIEGLELVSNMADRRNLPEIRDEARKYKTRLELKMATDR